MTTRRLRRSKRSGSKRSGSKRSGSKRSGSKRRGSSRRTRRYIKGAGFGSLFKSNSVGPAPSPPPTLREHLIASAIENRARIKRGEERIAFKAATRPDPNAQKIARDRALGIKN